MMIDATIISTTALNVLIALAGGLIGMTAAAIVVRESFVSHRALSLEHELRESMGTLERQRNDPEAIELALGRQALAVQQVRGYARRRSFFYRLLLGYVALISLALLSLYFVLRAQDISLEGGGFRWFGIGLAAAGVINFLVYALGAMRRLMVSSLAVKPMRIPQNLDVEAPREADIEKAMRTWLTSQGFEVTTAKVQSGLDLIAERAGERVLIGVRAIPLLTVKDVDAIVGAVARLTASESSAALVRAAIVVPGEALGSHASTAIHAAEAQRVDVFAVGEDGRVEAATSDGWADQAQAV